MRHDFLRIRKKLLKILFLLLAAFIGLLFVLPILVTVTNGFMTGFEVHSRFATAILPSNTFYTLEVFPQIHFVRMSLTPNFISFSQFSALFRHTGYMNALWNSIIITSATVVGQLVISVPAAYAFEFSKHKHKEKQFFVYVVVMLMPLPVLLVPQFVMANFLGISESYLAVILPGIFAPFGVFLLRQFLKTLPPELLEAAKIDGAGQIRILLFIVTPLMKPAISALALLVFVDFWNVVDQAIVFITDANAQPLSVYLARLTGNFEIIFAASIFYMIPPLLVFLHGQEHLMEGMKMSGIK